MASLAFAFRFSSGQFLGCSNQRLEGVGIIIVVNALHDGGDTLQPHAGINRWLGQRHIGAIILPFKLHEDEVPDFDKTVAIFIGASRGTTEDMLAMIVEDFTARPARSGITHRPEIVAGGDADDAMLRKARDLLPKVKRLIIGVIDCRRQLIGIKSPDFGQ